MKKMKKLFIDLWEGNITLWKTYWYLTLAGLIYYLPIYFLVPEDRYSVFAFTEIFSLFYIVFFLILCLVMLLAHTQFSKIRKVKINFHIEVHKIFAESQI